MTRLAAEGVNAPQIEYWNGPAGDRWARLADTQDLMIGGMGEAAMEACAIEPGHSVLDIGCGSGSTTLDLAARVGPEGRVLGIDISTPMLEVADARRQAAGIDNIAFENMDAATYAFKPAVFDRLYSRFGVMFFLDPVSAFRNIRPAAKDGARIAFCCWQARTENQWMDYPFNIALRHVPAPPPPAPGEPGPTAFADPDRVRNILTEGGFGDIEMELAIKPIILGPDTETAVERLVELGPTGRLLKDAPEEIKSAIADDLRGEIDQFVGDDGVTMEGRAWIVTAVAA
jgi:SAM-dependent methyltransferase